VVVPKDRSASLSASAIKASAGAGLFLPVVKVTNLARAIEELKRDGFWAYGASVKDGCSLYEIDWADKALIVLGGEGIGLRRLVKEKCDVLFSIPMGAG
jgi:23S rRNA (guanosine2251-2'-O)-methyltransferase